MPDATPIDAALAGLDELAACDLRLAKRFCARIEALPQDDDAKAMELARSYQRMARSYRQTLVVQARLRRELKAEAKADATDTHRREIFSRPERPSALEDTTLFRMARVETAAAERIRLEYDPSEAEPLEAELTELLYELWDDDFAELDPDVQLDALMARLREVAPRGGPDTPPPEDEDEDDADGAAAHAAPPHARWPEGRLAPPMDLPSWETDDTS
jgi:hypothetical protein